MIVDSDGHPPVTQCDLDALEEAIDGANVAARCQFLQLVEHMTIEPPVLPAQ